MDGTQLRSALGAVSRIKMRLPAKEKEVIKRAILKLDHEAKIFLFGSRTNPEKKGGDIDILVISKKLNLIDKASILNDIFKEMEEQKIDIVIKKDVNDPFIKVIMKEVISL